MLKKKQHVSIVACLAVLIAVSTCSIGYSGENVCGPATASEEQSFNLRLENELLKLRVKQFESTRTLSEDRLRQKKLQRLKEISEEVKLQRQSAADFEGFVTWMSTNLAGYSRYIQAGSYAAVVGRMLPIPYAGQASVFAKFIAQFTLSLNAASVSVANYLSSSQKFLALVDAIDPTNPPDENKLAEATGFADQKLLKDMNDVQMKLATVADLSAGALSFLESLNCYVSGTDEYWNKFKGLIKKDVDPKERSFISESTKNLKTQADRFNGKLKGFEELGKKETAGVKALAVYDELTAELVAPHLQGQAAP